MRAKGDKSKKMVKVPEAALLSLVVSKLKGKVLFPKKVENARAYLQNIKIENS